MNTLLATKTHKLNNRLTDQPSHVVEEIRFWQWLTNNCQVTIKAFSNIHRKMEIIDVPIKEVISVLDNFHLFNEKRNPIIVRDGKASLDILFLLGITKMELPKDKGWWFDSSVLSFKQLVSTMERVLEDFCTNY